MKRAILIFSVVAVAAMVIVGVTATTRNRSRQAKQTGEPMPPPVSAVSEPAQAREKTAAEIAPPVQTAEAHAAPLETSEPEKQQAAKPQKTAPASKPAKAKEPIQDPDARRALALVGEDPYAEMYWAAAINNPALSAHERQDLIEDLNEDGLSDPKHPGPEDLPLIVSRIELIEELAPYSMDQVNADAFAEAYKDLLNMLDRLPVR